MSFFPIDRDPPARHVRAFACGLALAAVLAGVERWRSGATTIALVVAIAGLAVAVVAFAAPVAGRRLYVGWMIATAPIGWVLSQLVLLVVYAAVATPTALILRLIGRDPLHRAFDRGATTYWSPHRRGADPERHFRQF